MSRIAMSGAEWQSGAAGVDLGANGTTLAIDTTTKHGLGAASYKVTGSIATTAVQNGILQAFGSNQTVVYGRCYMYIHSLDDTTAAVAAFFDLMNSSDVSVVSIQFYNDGGTLKGICYYDDFANDTGEFTTGVAFDQWMRVEFYFDTSPANGSEILQIRINGTTVVTLSNINYTNKNGNRLQFGVYNGLGTGITNEAVYFDDIAANNNSGSINNSWVGDSSIVALVPAGAGDNAPTAGTYASVNEIPVDDTATSSSNRIELDNNGTIADFTITSPASKGINSYDTIAAVYSLLRIREETAATTSYQQRIKSASGGTVTSTTAADVGNTTITTKRQLVETDPTTGVAWTPTGTNSLTNAQIGVSSGSANDIWATSMMLMVDVVPGTPPPAGATNLFFF